MNTSKIIKGVVGGGRYTVTAPIIKEDYGLYLQIEGIELPETYEVDFSNDEHSGSSVTMIGNSDGVLIPSQFIRSGKDVFAFLYHVGEDYGRTVFKFRIPNKVRPDRTNEEPTPEEQSTIDQTINAINKAKEEWEGMTAEAITLPPNSQATAEYADGVLTIGVPRGADGGGGGGGVDLYPATKYSLGGIIVGEDLQVTPTGLLSVVKANKVEQDNTHPITAAAVFTEVGNINALLQTI